MKWNPFPETKPLHNDFCYLKIFNRGYKHPLYGSKPDEYTYCFGAFATPYESDGIIRFTDTEVVYKRWIGFLGIKGERLEEVVAWLEIPKDEDKFEEKK